MRINQALMKKSVKKVRKWIKKLRKSQYRFIKIVQKKLKKTVQLWKKKIGIKKYTSYSWERVLYRIARKNTILGGSCVLAVFVVFFSWSHAGIDLRSGTSLDTADLIAVQTLDVDALYSMGVYGSANIAFRYKDINEDFAVVEDEIDEELVAFEEDLYAMVQGHPIEAMVPFIAQQERTVAALIVGIAKKESNWGKRAPQKDGETCYNYWGYKGGGSRGHALGYGCFEGPEEAIGVVGGRIHELAIDLDRETPQEMIIWKCGSSCAGHSPESVNKWIRDVDIYYSRLVAIAR